MSTSSFTIKHFKKSLPSVGQKIKLARQAKGMTQGELGEMIGISAKTVSAIEVGRVEPAVSHMQALAAVLEESIGYFVGENASSVESKMERVAAELEEIRKTMELIQLKKRNEN